MNKYLYICGIGSSISRFDISGKFINAINVNGYIKSIACDTSKNEIYVATGKKEIECYDYSLKKKKIYQVRYEPSGIFFYKNNLWMQSVVFDGENIPNHKISRLDMESGKEIFTPFNFKDYPLPEFKEKNVMVPSLCVFSIHNDEPIFAFYVDSIIYGIKNNKISSIIRWNILPTAQGINKINPVLATKGFIGRYLYINYYLNLSEKISRYMYLEDTKTGKKYNIRENGYYNVINDDIYNTGSFNINPWNKKESFYYIKEKNDVREATNKIKTSEGYVIFMVKTKQ
jgi:hypothetical protein